MLDSRALKALWTVELNDSRLLNNRQLSTDDFTSVGQVKFYVSASVQLLFFFSGEITENEYVEQSIKIYQEPFEAPLMNQLWQTVLTTHSSIGMNTSVSSLTGYF